MVIAQCSRPRPITDNYLQHVKTQSPAKPLHLTQIFVLLQKCVSNASNWFTRNSLGKGTSISLPSCLKGPSMKSGELQPTLEL